MSSSALKTIKNMESSEYFSAVFVISFNHPSAICHIQNYISTPSISFSFSFFTEGLDNRIIFACEGT
jgi:hypothetical protein